METAGESAEDLGDGGGGGDHDGSGSGTAVQVMKDGQDGNEQPAARTSEKDWTAMTKGQRKVRRRKQNKVKNRNAEPETRTHPDTHTE